MQGGGDTNATSIVAAWRLFTSAATDGSFPGAAKNGPYLYDLVDLTRQALANLFCDAQTQFEAAFQLFQFKKVNSTVQVTQIANFLQTILVGESSQRIPSNRSSVR
jgi:hypothetical protein